MSKRDHKDRKKKEREERIRQMKRRRRGSPTAIGFLEDGSEIRLAVDRLVPIEIPSDEAIEWEMRRKQEAPSMLGRVLSLFGGRSKEKQKRWKAQELAYQAMEEPNAAKARAMAEEALALDPDCSDALLVLEEQTERLEDKIALAEKAYRAGERMLGEAFFAKHKGTVWTVLRARPYMRARLALALMLHDAGRAREAIGHAEALLELNKNDNQGVRHLLFGWYFEIDDLEGVRRLLLLCEENGDDQGVYQWSRVLERFLSHDMTGAGNALKKAREVNPFVRPFLTGKQPLPPEAPDYYGFGDRNEAIYCAFEIGNGWKKHPSAVEWLKRQS